LNLGVYAIATRGEYIVLSGFTRELNPLTASHPVAAVAHMFEIDSELPLPASTRFTIWSFFST
jgi:hypothetical protein